MKFGRLVRRERIRLGLTQAELSRRMGSGCAEAYTRQIRYAENDAHNISLKSMARIADGLGCDLKIELVPRI